MRGDPERERERRHRPEHAVSAEVGGERSSEHDVGEVPERVRQMEHGDVVAPAARFERVERRLHLLRAHVTSPPPNESRLVCTSVSAASRQASCKRASGQRAWKSRIEPPRNEPTSRQPPPIARPADGSPTPTYSSQSGRQTPRGTPNSSPATIPPERTTRASSRSVAAGSLT